jgi:ABC-type phosphate transport system substrate-binding protein
MRRRAFLLGPAAALLARALGPALASAAEPEIAVFVHKDNRARLTATQLEQLFLTTMRQWPEGGAAAAVFNLPPRSEARVLFDRVVLRMSPDEVARCWIDRKVRGGEPPPRQVPDGTVVVRVVAQLEGSVGYAQASLVDPSVRVIARIKAGRLLLAGGAGERIEA